MLFEYDPIYFIFLIDHFKSIINLVYKYTNSNLLIQNIFHKSYKTITILIIINILIIAIVWIIVMLITKSY